LEVGSGSGRLRALSRAMMALMLSRIKGVGSMMPVSLQAVASKSSSRLMVVRLAALQASQKATLLHYLMSQKML